MENPGTEPKFYIRIFSAFSGFFKNTLGQFFRKFLFAVENPSQPENKQFIFLFCAWSFFLLFTLGSILANKNPFMVLIPFSLYEKDRKEDTINAIIHVSDGKGKVYPSKRGIHQIPGDMRSNILLQISEIGKPPFYSAKDQSDSEYHGTLKKLPDLQGAVITIWILDQGKKVLIDFREDSIQEELTSLRFRVEDEKVEEDPTAQDEEDGHFKAKTQPQVLPEKRAEDVKKIRLSMLNSTFLAIEKTLFANFPELQTLEFRLDGEKKDYPGLGFDLRLVRNRNNSTQKE